MRTSLPKNIIVRKDSPVFTLFPSLSYSLRKKKVTGLGFFFLLALCFFLHPCQSHEAANFTDIKRKMSAAFLLPTTGQSPLVFWLTLSWAAIW